jgi:hypothetical protein
MTLITLLKIVQYGLVGLWGIGTLAGTGFLLYEVWEDCDFEYDLFISLWKTFFAGTVGLIVIALVMAVVTVLPADWVRSYRAKKIVAHFTAKTAGADQAKELALLTEAVEMAGGREGGTLVARARARLWYGQKADAVADLRRAKDAGYKNFMAQFGVADGSFLDSRTGVSSAQRKGPGRVRKFLITWVAALDAMSERALGDKALVGAGFAAEDWRNARHEEKREREYRERVKNPPKKAPRSRSGSGWKPCGPTDYLCSNLPPIGNLPTAAPAQAVPQAVAVEAR